MKNEKLCKEVAGRPQSRVLTGVQIRDGGTLLTAEHSRLSQEETQRRAKVSAQPTNIYPLPAMS